MLKRFMALWLVLVLCLGAGSALAGSSLRHKVYGDVSEFVVSEELDQAAVDGAEAQVGTDVYLYVDPYTASYVTFVVVDEEGRPIKGAAIYLSYGGATEFYGTTDADGKFSTYVFRDTTYGFTVKKSGYRSESGEFTATRETKTIRLVLRKYHQLDIIVLKDGNPVPGIKVRFSGQEKTTSDDGSVRYWTVSGLYDAEIILPDGSMKAVVISVEGNTVYIVHIGTEDWPEDIPEELLNGGGGLSDLFIVFDKFYAPEDYDLTEQVYEDEELLAQLDLESITQEEIDAMLKAYHMENGDFLHVVAEPDKIQHEDAPDEIVLDENGEAVYSQRSLILSGWQLRLIENRGMESILFENENMAVKFEIADLYSENIARLFWLLENIDEHRVEYDWYDAENLAAAEVPYEMLPDVWRWMEEKPEQVMSETMEEEEIPVFTEADFGNSRLEVRITPALAEEVEHAALGIEKKLPESSMSEILLISGELRAKWLAEYLADGYLSDTEYAEIKDVCVHGNAYRVQVFLRIGGKNINVTQMLESMEVIVDVNRDAVTEAEAYAEQKIAQMLEDASNTKTRNELAEEYWEVFMDEYLTDVYGTLHGIYGVRNEGIQADDRDYAEGDSVFTVEALIDDGVPEVGEFLNALNARTVDIYDVDVRHEEYEFKNEIGYSYYPVAAVSEDVSIAVSEDWHVGLQSNLSGMYLIREIGCMCIEEARQALLEQE